MRVKQETSQGQQAEHPANTNSSPKAPKEPAGTILWCSGQGKRKTLQLPEPHLPSSPLSNQLGWGQEAILQLGWASDTKGVNEKVRDKAQSKPQYEAGLPGLLPAAGRCTKGTLPQTHPHSTTHSSPGNLLRTSQPKVSCLPPASRKSCHFVHGWDTSARKPSKQSMSLQIFLQHGVEAHS